MACLFLYFRCVELALKAVLVYHGVSESEITKSLRHHIARLVSRVEDSVSVQQIGIRPEDRAFLERFSDDYADKWFEYSGKWFRGSREPRMHELRDLAHRVSEAVREHLHQPKPVRKA